MNRLVGVNRVEVIGPEGRSFVFDPRAHPGARISVETSMQDNGRTLKVFIRCDDSPAPPGPPDPPKPPWHNPVG